MELKPTNPIAKIIGGIQWRIVLLVVKPALLALAVAIVDVGLLDGAMLEALEGFLRDVRLAAARS